MSGAVGSVEWMMTEGQSQRPAVLGQPIDTRTFQQYDRNNATARQQVLNARDSLAPIFRPVDRTALQDVLQGNAPMPTDAEQRQTVSNALGVIPMAGITTFHGSPTSGIKQFSNAFRGTGEGRLAADSPAKESFKDMIAHGLYTAENQGIAKGYQERLANNGLDSLHNHLIFNDPTLLMEVKSRLKDSGNFGKDIGFHTLNNAIQNAAISPSQLMSDTLGTDLIAKIQSADKSRTLRNGSTYTAELLPNPNEYLHWDKPLSEQSDHVKKALGGNPYPNAEWNTGQKIYEGIGGKGQKFENAGQQQRYAAEYLDSLGIKGVKYLDGSSRRAGEGMHNYVTFSPGTQSVITHENGQRIPGAVEDAYARLRDPESKSILEQRYPELRGLLSE